MEKENLFKIIFNKKKSDKLAKEISNILYYSYNYFTLELKSQLDPPAPADTNEHAKKISQWLKYLNIILSAIRNFPKKEEKADKQTNHHCCLTRAYTSSNPSGLSDSTAPNSASRIIFKLLFATVSTSASNRSSATTPTSGISTNMSLI